MSVPSVPLQLRTMTMWSKQRGHIENNTMSTRETKPIIQTRKQNTGTEQKAKGKHMRLLTTIQGGLEPWRAGLYAGIPERKKALARKGKKQE